MARSASIALIAGLGNPGDEYCYTRHNLGFLALDALADQLGVRSWKLEAGCLVARVAHPRDASHTLILAKPQSFMNTAGGPISKLLKAEGLQASHLLVIHDEIDLAPGVIQLKQGGGLNAHNGLRSLSNKLMTRDFMRVRIGFGRPPGKMDVARFVLQETKGQAREELLIAAQDAAALIMRDVL